VQRHIEKKTIYFHKQGNFETKLYKHITAFMAMSTITALVEICGNTVDALSNTNL
jgi:hypothetical protein